ncbi:MAG TPA: hypothetical protein VF054_12300 [Micromonosporaceae bacterium]
MSVLDLGLDGLEVLAAAHDGREIPVVVLTARSGWTTAFSVCAAAPTTTSPSRSARQSWCFEAKPRYTETVRLAPHPPLRSGTVDCVSTTPAAKPSSTGSDSI